MAGGSHNGLTLHTDDGVRKYLSPKERSRFYAALSILQDPFARSFCEMIFWTGCRPSEALALKAQNVDLSEGVVVIRSVKKRGNLKGRHFRTIPLPDGFLKTLNEIHKLSAIDATSCRQEAPLWTFGRTTAWRRMRDVMDAADIRGAKACAKGLRHSYGVTAALSRVPETRIKKWLGHASLATTEIYLDMAGPEDRAMAARMWGDGVEDAPG